MAKKELLFILAGLLFLNIFIFFATDQISGVSASAYRELKETIMSIPLDERIDWIHGKYSDLMVLYDIDAYGNGTLSPVMENNAGYLTAQDQGMTEQQYLDLYNAYMDGEISLLSENYETEILLYERLESEVEAVEGYDEFLKKVRDEAAQNSKLSVFLNNGDGFTIRNMKKTADDFARCEGTQISFSGGYGLEKTMESGITDIIVLLVLIYGIMQLVIEERKSGMMSLIRTTDKGGMVTMWYKYGALLLFCILVTMLFWGSSFLYAIFVYGQVDFSLPVQSFPGFSESAVQMSIGNYLIVFLLIKIFMYFLLGTIGMLVAVCVSQMAAFYGVIGVIVAISAGMNSMGLRLSQFSYLRHCNLIYLCHGTGLLRKYLNFDIFGYPISHICADMILSVMLLVICMAASTLVYGSGSHIQMKSLSLPRRKNKKGSTYKTQIKKVKRNSLFGHECYKLVAGQKCLLVFIILVLVQGFLYSDRKPAWNETLAYYKSYMETLDGEITPEKENYLEEETDRFEKIHQQIDALDQKYTEGSIKEEEYNTKLDGLQKQLDGEEALAQVKERYEYLKEYETATGISLPFLYDRGWRHLFSLDTDFYKRDFQSAFFAAASMLLLLSGIMAQEQMTGMQHLCNVYYNGRSIWRKKKYLLALLVTTAVFLLAYLPEIIWTIHAYGLPHCFARMAATPGMKDGLCGLSLVGCLFILYLIRYLSLLVTAALILLLSQKMGNTYAVMLLGVILFLLPLTIHMLGFGQLDHLSMNQFYSGNMILKK